MSALGYKRLSRPSYKYDRFDLRSGHSKRNVRFPLI